MFMETFKIYIDRIQFLVNIQKMLFAIKQSCFCENMVNTSKKRGKIACFKQYVLKISIWVSHFKFGTYGRASR